MKKSKILAALVIGAMIGTMTSGVNPANAESHVVINGTGVGGDTWRYGYTENDTLWTSDTNMGDHDEDYLKYIGGDIEDDVTLNDGGSLETHHTHANGTLTANGGSLNVASGTLHINAGSSIADTVNLTVAGTLDLNGGNVIVSGTDNITGAINASAGNLTFNGTRTLNSANYTVGGSVKTIIEGTVTSNISLAGTNGIQINSGSLTIDADNVDGAVANAVDNGLILTGGTLGQNVSGAGSTKISTAGTVTNNATISQGVNVDSGTFQNNANHSVTGTTSINNGATATNYGTLNAVTNSGTLNIYGGTVASVNNATNTSSTTHNAGTVSGAVTNSGTYELSGTGTINGLVTNGNTFNLKNNGVTNYTQTTGTLNITNDGSLTLTNGTNTITGGNVVLGEATGNTKGTLIINNGLATNAAQITNAGNGASVLKVQGDSTLALNSNSAITSAVQLTVDGGSTLNIASTAAGDGVVIDAADIWSGIVDLDGGTLTILGDNGKAGSLDADGGNLVIGSALGAGILNLNNANDDIATAVTVTVAAGSKLNQTAGSAVLNTGDNWAGEVALGGGALELNTLGVETDGVIKYNQTAGTLTIDNNGSLTLSDVNSKIITNSEVVLGENTGNTNGKLILNNGSVNQAKITTSGTSANNELTVKGKIGDNVTKLTLSDGSDIEYGKVTVGDAAGNASELTMAGNTNGSTIAKAVAMVINEGAKVNMTGTASALTINTGDTWNGVIDHDAGTLTILNADYTKGDNAYLDSDGGILKIGDGTTVGTLALGNASDDIAKATQVTIYGGSTLSMTKGNVILDSAAGSADTWDGAISLTGDNAKLTLSGRDDTANPTTAAKTYNQSKGTLTIDNDGTLTLNTSASKITGGNVVLGENTNNTSGTLVFNNASDNTAKITTSGTSANNALTVQGADLTDPTNPVNTTLTLADGSDIEYGTVTVGDAASNANVLTMSGDTNGSTIAKAVTMVVNNGAKVDMTGTASSLTINTGDTWNGQINQTAGTLTVLNDDYTRATGYLTSNGGSIVIGDTVTPVAGTLILNNANDAITAATAVTINAGSKLNQSAGNVVLNSGNDTWAGEIALSGTGNLTLKDFSGANNVVTDGTIKYNQTGGNATLDNTDLELAYNATAANTSAVTNGSVALTNTSTLTITNGLATNRAAVTMAGANETLNILNVSKMVLDNYGNVETNITAGTLNIGDAADNTDHTVLEVASGTIAKAATVNLNEGAALNITGAMSSDESTPGAGDEIVTAITLDAADTWNGDINLSNASGGNADDSIVSLNLDGVNIITGANPTFDNTGALPYYSQTGGDLALINNTSLSMADSSLISGGNLSIDTSSVYNSLSNGFSITNLTTAGLINGINAAYENYAVATNFNVGDVVNADNHADFTTDLYARSNNNKNYDTYGSNTDTINALIDTDGDGKLDAVLNVSDWTLNGDLYGYDAPLDERITMNNLFKGNVNALHDISFTSTNKEVFTPIGWYALNSTGGGNYSFDLTKFNPGVFRGQVSTLAQYQNQLMIDDMLFNHAMLDQGFKGNDYIVSNPNLLASASDLYPPYQYSRKDGGVWVKMYGTFENLNMSQGLHVGNNAYGTLIGVDFGLKDLKKGWQFMPTVYLGYNGAHQYWDGYGAYQNGGQLGVMGTWYKNNFMIGALAYGGIYGNDMSTPRRDDHAFNYFAGGSVKTAYNWKFAKDWSLQPNLMVAYNYFGEQNWHSDFGQMGMMSGMLHGVNIAPGLNLIWEKETFSIYGTIQYMYNVNQSIGGRAGNVNLPSVHMDRGYLQYGLGFNKKFTDKFSGFFQAVVRNVGRTGIGLQMGFQWQLGKGGSNNRNSKGKITPELKKADVTLKGNKLQ